MRARRCPFPWHAVPSHSIRSSAVPGLAHRAIDVLTQGPFESRNLAWSRTTASPRPVLCAACPCGIAMGVVAAQACADAAGNSHAVRHRPGTARRSLPCAEAARTGEAHGAAQGREAQAETVGQSEAHTGAVRPRRAAAATAAHACRRDSNRASNSHTAAERASKSIVGAVRCMR